MQTIYMHACSFVYLYMYDRMYVCMNACMYVLYVCIVVEMKVFVAFFNEEEREVRN